ncbi:MAG: type II secretion system ATPase GspE [Woeseiaceae bacterium]|jgi:general secretion pathway protein E|nr:type II secretion system ATPase GspE [Woeseiaceae bacterium]MDG1865989.1 type II secretion system ATPase GspE [Woeseiaceae bacterium]|tara:strand:- start:1813 stop:3339 length:1527 start_codon:yes stop_codon:yes gene_type:complete
MKISNSSEAITENPKNNIQSPELTKKLPFSFVKKHKILINSVTTNSVEVVYFEDVPLEIISETRRFAERPLSLKKVSSLEFDELLRKSYEENSQTNIQIAENIKDNDDLLTVAKELPEQADLLDSDNDAPIIRFINAILTEALKNKASDIHIEPFESRLVVRFRIDGMLNEILETRRAITPLIISRIKVMAKLDIAEKRLPQDGRITLKIAGRSVDVRVSTIPSGFGERIVMRLLDKQAGRLDLSSLGMELELMNKIDKLIHRPHGIILVTGPTGSGKTTTLYAALERINNNTRNIMTVEDPIEYLIDGIGQTQVNKKISMTFAKGLRAILRQDPDVVMIGEIRDLETAEIAIQASLTGHLVLATLHTNTAIGAVTRLRDMGVEPFLLSSSLIGVIAQRLVRVLNDETKEAYLASAYECEALKVDYDTPPSIYKNNTQKDTGYDGRTGIYELINVDDNMKTLIHDGASERELELEARTSSKSIRADGRRQVLAGITSLEEVLRVTQEG